MPSAKEMEKAIESLAILIADPNVYTRKLTRMMLVNLGAKTIFEVGDGVAALDAIRNVSPDVMILNWDLPILDGTEVTTVEGLDTPQKLHPVQEAFVETAAFQCGYCTPGFVLMTHQLLEKNPDPSEDEIKHYLSGNLCRCGTHTRILKAVERAARTFRGEG